MSLATPDHAGYAAAVIDVPADIGRTMAACWQPPHAGDEVTLRMSFRRDGSVFGKPYVTYVKAADRKDAAVELTISAPRAAAACTPLRFTAPLEAAIASRVFLIRSVARRASRAAAL